MRCIQRHERAYAADSWVDEHGVRGKSWVRGRRTDVQVLQRCLHGCQFLRANAFYETELVQIWTNGLEDDFGVLNSRSGGYSIWVSNTTFFSAVIARLRQVLRDKWWGTFQTATVCCPFQITGHSLGGALASMAAAHISSNYFYTKER